MILFVFINCCSVTIKCQFYACHDDPGFNPEDGMLTQLRFTWLGALQYIHVKTGNPHYYRVPRVVLISRQFVLCTANDAAKVPDGYALGNVAFSDYERDEVECGLTLEEIAAGIDCDPAILLVPIADVLLHPEYKHFHVNHSVALLKLVITIRSKYMLPLCLPFKNYLKDEATQSSYRILHVDFTSDVPRDFAEEEKEVYTVKVFNTELCNKHGYAEALMDLVGERPNSSHVSPTRVLCSTGCGFRSGAPTVIHEHTGHWSIVALSAGTTQCPDPLRSRSRHNPPHHIALYDYVNWITAAIAGKVVSAFAQDDPFGFVMPRTSRIVERGQSKWVGHWWMGGLRCYDRGDAATDLYKFYHEIFSVKPTTSFRMTYYLEINAPHTTAIACVKIGMPYAVRGDPKIWDLNSPTVKLRIPLIHFTQAYKFHVEAWGYNVTSVEESDEDD
ncbi:unnamed protein product [Arctia plantaginis]|uniref:Uncharacterized protein n=1 Tax=Arctia plantaginis TaxID=874455 RepID=A0A8S0Z366_ARCPL|nr:unnamed protein product [Arctia plantaginis]